MCLTLALVAVVGAGLACAWALVRGHTVPVRTAEISHTGALLLVAVASAVLMRALVARDFSFQYVASYTDTFLPMFYAVTAFWAGQAGSFLLWLLCVAVLAGVFVNTASYRELEPRTKAWFWLTHCAVMAFFLIILVGPSSPFITLDPAPAQGNGLNPLLRKPGHDLPSAAALHRLRGLHRARLPGRGGVDQRRPQRLARRRSQLESLGLAVPHRRHRSRGLVVLHGAGLGRLLGLGPGRERLAHPWLSARPSCIRPSSSRAATPCPGPTSFSWC